MSCGWGGVPAFGLPAAAVTLAIEDWLVLRVALDSRRSCDMTIIGLSKTFSKVRPDPAEELPANIACLQKAHFIARSSGVGSHLEDQLILELFCLGSRKAENWIFQT